ncbi:MAG TPA: hypothetical protein PLQ76_04300, partial [bacterium]|nr:hypothetical protein [bacterium]
FYTHVQMRTSREGYMFARTSAFATETYRYVRSAGDTVCVKTFCDRVDPATITLARVQFQWFMGGAACNVALAYNATGEYYWACRAVGPPCVMSLPGGTRDRVIMTLTDSSGETCTVEDSIWVAN